ncbi:hypothetical protein D3Y57_13270 [Sphingomonas paeninsulae]|uniref:Uncharacterized protein n=1 Tax=Sphingomonas paeninsulae TaxID=2319844 RepID=A0A494TH33_SPHPE|nr:hypothetical protein D3Y57_13270 [Sphingomonas paeninsulae]
MALVHLRMDTSSCVTMCCRDATWVHKSNPFAAEALRNETFINYFFVMSADEQHHRRMNFGKNADLRGIS